MIRWHRICAFFSAILLVYVVVTGTGIQLADMRALLTAAPETDPDILMMRQHINGPPNYAVVSAPDYTAASLPATLDHAAALRTTAALGRAAFPDAAMRLVELRSVAGSAAGHVQMGEHDLLFDLRSGAPLPARYLPPPEPSRDFPSTRSTFKYFHRFNYLGQAATGLDGLAGVALSILIFTGLVHYARLYRARAKGGRRALLWRGGGAWRYLHRWTAVCASVFLVWIAATGLLLSLDNVGAFVNGLRHGPPVGQSPFDGDFSAPLRDADLAAMTATTLAAFHAAYPGVGIKVLRLRDFAGYSQGVIIGADPATSQLVFNAVTGASMSMTEKGYPALGFPSGWKMHQWLKRLHRGDAFGMTGRWLDLIGGLALVYLSVSGIVLYLQLWMRRKRNGRAAVLW